MVNDGMWGGSQFSRAQEGGLPEGTQTIVLLLTGSIPKTELDGLLTSRQVYDVIVEHGGDILWRRVYRWALTY
jgi:hypothetical protein